MVKITEANKPSRMEACSARPRSLTTGKKPTEAQRAGVGAGSHSTRLHTGETVLPHTLMLLPRTPLPPAFKNWAWVTCIYPRWEVLRWVLVIPTLLAFMPLVHLLPGDPFNKGEEQKSWDIASMTRLQEAVTYLSFCSSS